MQTIQFKVNDNYLQIVLSLLKNLKQGIIEDLSIVTDNKKMEDNSTDYNNKPTFKYKKLNPMENYYTLKEN